MKLNGDFKLIGLIVTALITKISTKYQKCVNILNIGLQYLKLIWIIYYIWLIIYIDFDVHTFNSYLINPKCFLIVTINIISFQSPSEQLLTKAIPEIFQHQEGSQQNFLKLAAPSVAALLKLVKLLVIVPTVHY